MKSFVISILMIMISVVLLFAGPGDQPSGEREEIVRARLIAPTKELIKQESSSILVEINILEGWHINSDHPLEDFLIPTEIRFEESVGVTFGRIQYMEPECGNFHFPILKCRFMRVKYMSLQQLPFHLILKNPS